jgi:hypothetical protein
MLVCFAYYITTDTDDVQASDSSIDRLTLLLSRCVRPFDPQLISVTSATSSICDRTMQLLQMVKQIKTACRAVHSYHWLWLSSGKTWRRIVTNRSLYRGCVQELMSWCTWHKHCSPLQRDCIHNILFSVSLAVYAASSLVAAVALSFARCLQGYFYIRCCTHVY